MSVELDPTLYYRITDDDENEAVLRFAVKGDIFGAEQELTKLQEDRLRKDEIVLETHGLSAFVSPGALEEVKKEGERKQELYPLLRDSASNCFKRFPESVTVFPSEPPFDELVLKTEDETKITLGRQTKLHPYVGNPRFETFLITYNIADWSVGIEVGG